MNLSTRHTIRIALVVSMGGFLFGFDASVISGVIRFIRPQFDLTDLQLGWVVSSPSISAMLAMLVAGPMSDRIGRKRILEGVAFLYVFSAVSSALAPNVGILITARMVGGAAFGAALVLAPMYIAEIAPAGLRGRLVSVQQLNIVLGFSAAYFSNYLLLGALGDAVVAAEANVWRWMLGIEAVPAAIYFLLLFTIPRSPRWLVSKGLTDEAADTLRSLHGPEEAEREIREITESIRREEVGDRAAYRELVGRGMKTVFSIAVALGVLQQITGVNAIYFYAPMIFEQSGIGANASFAQAVWVGVVNVAFTVVAMLLIDRLGRRPLLLAGLAGIVLSMSVTAYGFRQAEYTLATSDLIRVEAAHGRDVAERLEPMADVTFSNDVEFKQAARTLLGPEGYRTTESVLIESAITMNPLIVLAGILGFVASFAASLGPVMWVMLSELFPTRLRGIGISIIGFINSFVSWSVQFLFPLELSTIGSAGTYLLYGLFAAIGFVVLYFILPETKGRSLEQLEEELSAA
ncbi:MAG: sugar porter family MFS transporter [Rhodothermales bacterium]|nr:sugar porter family MFS transporter [Rhodothermales bacterium]